MTAITSEAQLTRAVGEALRVIPGIMVIRRNVGRRGHQRFGVVGECDYEVIVGPRGRCAGIELKWGDGKRTPEQVEWANRLRQVGAAYTCTDSLMDAIDFVLAVISEESSRIVSKAPGLP